MARKNNTNPRVSKIDWSKITSYAVALNTCNSMRKEYDKLLARTQYIIGCFGKGADYYVWVDDVDGKIEISYEVASKPVVIIDKTGHPVNLCNTFPARWLFEDGFQKEIRDGVKLAKTTNIKQVTKDPAGLLKNLSNNGCGKVTIRAK